MNQEKQLRELKQEHQALENAQAIERVRELHVQETPITEFCKECSYTYPCPTIQALDGEIGSVEPVKLEALDGEQDT